MEQDATAVDFTARLLTELVRTENIAALRHSLPEALPWVTFLPAEDVDTLLSELMATARGTMTPDLRRQRPPQSRRLAPPRTAHR